VNLGDHVSVPAALRRELGGLIRQARRSRGLTQTDLAGYLGCSQGKINKIEAGENTVKLPDLATIIEVLGVDDELAHKMTTLAEQAGPGEPWAGPRKHIPAWFRRYEEREAVATQILGWRGERIPGLLQSEHFMLELFSAAGLTDVTAYVRNRRARTKIFERPHPPECEFILSEAVFHRIPHGFSTAAALDQIQHLLGLGDNHPRLGIRVLPFTAPLMYPPGDYTILRFDNRHEDLVFTESLVAADYRTKPHELATFAQSWDQISAVALDAADSRQFLQELVTELRQQVTF
jgi:transcriptional regulator with XRE-family HTH domain